MDVPDLACALIDAIRNDRIVDAERLLAQLSEVFPDPRELIVLRVVLAIQQGRARDALRELEELSGDSHPELRALCLHVLNEPHWVGCARGLQDSEEPGVRDAMRQLLGLRA